MFRAFIVAEAAFFCKELSLEKSRRCSGEIPLLGSDPNLERDFVFPSAQKALETVQPGGELPHFA